MNEREAPQRTERSQDGLPAYIEIIQLIEALHRQLLEAVRRELERTGVSEVNAVHGLLLFNIGSQVMRVGDLTARGLYRGANVSYNLKKLIDLEYISSERSEADRRSVRIQLTGKGLAVRDIVGSLFHRHSEDLFASRGLGPHRLENAIQSLQHIERYWNEEIRCPSSDNLEHRRP